MAGSKSNQLETDFLNWCYSAAAVTRPSAWYVGLFTDAAGLAADQPATEATTTNCPGYARQQVTSWTVSGNQSQNAAAVTFTASGAWAGVNYWGIFDALTGGRLLHWGEIKNTNGQIVTVTLANTNQLKFDVNQLTITED